MQIAQPNFLQINSLGSKDPNNINLQNTLQEWVAPEHRTQDIDPGRNIETGAVASPEGDTWDATPNHPIIQGFQNLFNSESAKTKFDYPHVQNFLFDVDNTVKGSAGIFRENQQGLSPFGTDIDGKPLHAFDEMRNSNDFSLGKNRLYNTGSIVQQLGVFDHPDDADRFAKTTNLSSDANFMGRVEGLQSQGNTKGAVDTILNELGHPSLDDIAGSPDPKRSYGVAFAAYNYAQNSEKMSPAQRSLSLSTMGLTAYQFKDGTDLSSRPVIKHPDGSTALSVGDALGMAGAGVDIFSLQKNWDQMDTMQRLTYGKGTASQMVATGQRLGLLGNPALGGASVPHTDAQLGQAGFTSIPSAGIGAITGHGDALPDGYEVVGSGQKPGQVIAVPKGLSYSTATINGTNEIRSLNAADGVRKAGTGAFKVASQWLPMQSKVLNARGTSFASGLGQSGVMQDPYLTSAMVTTSVFGNTTNKRSNLATGIDAIKTGAQVVKGVDALNSGTAGTGVPYVGIATSAAKGVGILASDASGEDKATALRRTGEDATAAYFTAGLSSAAQTIDRQYLGGKGEKTREKLDAINPITQVEDKVTGKVIDTATGAISKAPGAFGGKSKEQSGRDKGRGLFKDITDGNWAVTLSDGSKADIGIDGHGGQHEFRFPEKDPNNVGRSLNAYDVDYTNDLDFSANMMTNSLARLVAGGKGDSIDQVGGQMANASLGKVGFGKDMTEENFNYVRDNVRGFFFKKGIQTKEDAYALMNQQFGTGRISEMDQMAMQQGINMVFEDDGFGKANVLMAGRQKGLEVAGEIPKAPGPNFDVHHIMPATPSIDPGRNISGPEIDPGRNIDPGYTMTADQVADETDKFPEAMLKFNPGTYGGNANTDAFTKSIIKYDDQYRQKRAT